MPPQSDNPSEQRRQTLQRLSGTTRRTPGPTRKPESEISYSSLRKREQRERRRGLSVPKRPLGRHDYQNPQRHETTAEDIIPVGPAREVFEEWRRMGIKLKLFQSKHNGEWWIQAHDRSAPLSEFIETANREAANAKAAQERGENF